MSEKEFRVIRVYSTPKDTTSSPISQMKVMDVIIVPKQYCGNGIIAFKNSGHVMEELIMDGAYVGVNTADQCIVSGEMYLIKVEHEYIIRKVYSKQLGLLLLPEQKGHPPIEILERATDTIIGRVVWIFNNRRLL